jgi:hypothetical protein
MTDPFHVRFDIDVPIDEARRRFVNRIENCVRRAVESVYSESNDKADALRRLLAEIQTTVGEPFREYVRFSEEFMEVWRQLVRNDFSRCLQALEAFYNALQRERINIAISLNLGVIKSMSQSETDIGVTWQSGFFLKKGAQLLDEKLVNEPLRWLADAKYQNVLIPFRKGLSHLLEGTNDSQRFGDAVTDMYESLEAMARIATGKPAKDLSALREKFVAKLGLPPTYRTMLKEYIDYGCDFRHAVETGQQRSWPLEREAEAFVYLTGLFLRQAIQSEKA